jgi:hypothetical protein
MELGFNADKMKRVFVWKNLRQFFLNFIFGQIRSVIFVMAVIMLVYCIYLWYNFIYRSEWSESQKQEYIRTKDQGVIFNNSRFERAMAESQTRKQEFQKSIDNLEDIFRVKK